MSTFISLWLFSIRSLGSAALNMCSVAAGRCDGYFEFGIHCWDVAAGIVIVEEAGGVCLSPSGILTKSYFTSYSLAFYQISSCC